MLEQSRAVQHSRDLHRLALPTRARLPSASRRRYARSLSTN